MYAIYAITIIFSFRNLKSKKIKFYFYIFLYLFSFGVLMELLQGIYTNNRHADIKDAIANGIGALIGIVFAFLFVKKSKK
jgi:VanZ family protein